MSRQVVSELILALENMPQYPDRLCDLRSHASSGRGDIIIDADSICHIEREMTKAGYYLIFFFSCVHFTSSMFSAHICKLL